MYIWLPKQNTTKKDWVDKTTSLLLLNDGEKNGREYKAKVINDSGVYTRDSGNQTPGPYYLLFWKGYSAEENS